MSATIHPLTASRTLLIHSLLSLPPTLPPSFSPSFPPTLPLSFSPSLLPSHPPSFSLSLSLSLPLPLTLHSPHGLPSCPGHSQITLHIHRLAVHQIELKMTPQNIQQVLYDVCTIVKEIDTRITKFGLPLLPDPFVAASAFLVSFSDPAFS